MDNNLKVEIPGELYAPTESHKVCSAEGVYDYDLQEYQSILNKKFNDICSSGLEFPNNPVNGLLFYILEDDTFTTLGLYYYKTNYWVKLSEFELKYVNGLPQSGISNSLYFNIIDKKLYLWDNSIRDWIKISKDNDKGTSDERPNNLITEDEGYMYYDTTLHKPIFWNGEYWIDINGLPVDDIIGTISTRPRNPSEGYMYFDTTDHIIIHADTDESGNVLWLDSNSNHYEVLEFNGFEEWDENDLTYTEQSYNNANNLDIKCISYLDLIHFFVLSTNNSKYFNWESKQNVYSSECYLQFINLIDDLTGRTQEGVIIRDKIYSTPYFFNNSNNKMYRYNEETHKLEELQGLYKNSGTILQRPINLSQESSGVFKYYDTTLEKELIYNQDDCGNDLWLDSDGKCYNIVNFDYNYISHNPQNAINVNNTPESPYSTSNLYIVTQEELGELPQAKIYLINGRFYVSNNIQGIIEADENLILYGIAYREWSCLNNIRSGNRLSSYYFNRNNNKLTMIFHNTQNDKYYHYDSERNFVEFNI